MRRVHAAAVELLGAEGAAAEAAAESAPRTFVLAARASGAGRRRWAPATAGSRPAGRAARVRPRDGGDPRPATGADLDELCRVADALPEVGVVSAPAGARRRRDRRSRELARCFAATSKHVSWSRTSGRPPRPRHGRAHGRRRGRAAKASATARRSRSARRRRRARRGARLRARRPAGRRRRGAGRRARGRGAGRGRRRRPTLASRARAPPRRRARRLRRRPGRRRRARRSSTSPTRRSPACRRPARRRPCSRSPATQLAAHVGLPVCAGGMRHRQPRARLAGLHAERARASARPRPAPTSRPAPGRSAAARSSPPSSS